MTEGSGLFPPRALAVLTLAALVAAGGACGGAPGTGGTGRAARGGTLTVFAAASLTGAFAELGKRFEAGRPHTTVRFNFGGSPTLARQVAAGAPADVVALAAETEMDRLTEAGLVEPGRAFAVNRLAILVATGNPHAIRSLDHLSRRGIDVVVCAAEVPCGRLTAAALARAGTILRPRSYEASVKAVVTRVSLGEADAGIVYETDVRDAPAGTEGVLLPAESDLTTSYSIARLRRSARSRQADAFISFVLSAVGRRILADAGFRAP